MKLMILDKNERWSLHKSKVYEECLELVEAINSDDQVHIAEEAFDIIQVATGILDKLHHEGIDIQQAIYRHNKKLINRGWKCKAIIKVQINRR
jgi:NTP pyrophosphatase (non-canonical NTP hydrolase)